MLAGGEEFYSFLLFADTTAQAEHSQCPLMEMHVITFLFLVYRYDSTTGTFTVPSGGDGFYYFSVYLTTISSEFANFDLEVNTEILCSAYAELNNGVSLDEWGTSCSGVAELMEGKLLNIYCWYSQQVFL